MRFFVYYEDGYYENGDVGFVHFETKEDVAEFIERRMGQDPERTLKSYQVIIGDRVKLSAIETVTRVQVGKS